MVKFMCVIDMAVNKLDALGCIKNSSDDWALKYAYDRACSYVQAQANLKKIPCELKTVLVDLTVSEFLSYKKVSGGFSALDTERTVKQIQEGDISVTYSDCDSYDTRFDKLISQMKDNALAEILSYRRLKW